MPFLAMLLCGGALGRTRLGVIQVKIQPANLQAVTKDHPERCALEFFAQGAEHFLPRIRAVVVSELLQLRQPAWR